MPMYIYDDIRLYSDVALTPVFITKLVSMYSNRSKLIPSIHYSFDLWTTGTTITNEGYRGSWHNATLVNGASILQNSPVTGNNYLSLTGANQQYLTVWFESLYNYGWSVCFWYKKEPTPIYESDVPVFTMSWAQDGGTNEISVGFYSTTGDYI